MPTIVRLIALALVITHTTGGCCLHHAHAEEGVTSGKALLGDNCGGHHRPLSEGGRDTGEHSHHGDDSPCDEGDCTFYPGRLRSDDRLASSDTPIMLLAETLAPALGVDAAHRELNPTARGIPPAPLFVLHQALLL